MFARSLSFLYIVNVGIIILLSVLVLVSAVSFPGANYVDSSVVIELVITGSAILGS